uniref:LIM zinc-binding domain-containing protein n=1 Tax=Timema bartmani TaxID=61472 RepID=A0A7R9EZ06_9NEOP|nr:unnamed protein product [Timema bartmani]
MFTSFSAKGCRTGGDPAAVETGPVRSGPASVATAVNTTGGQAGVRECAGCGKRITERFLLKVRVINSPSAFQTGPPVGVCKRRGREVEADSSEPCKRASRLLRTAVIRKESHSCKAFVQINLLCSQALDLFWHEDCLKCGCCDCRLGEVGSTLYTKANLILCKRDYLRLFGTTGYCAACNKVIPAFEMVMRAKSNVYHLECFACQQCNHR